MYDPSTPLPLSPGGRLLLLWNSKVTPTPRRVATGAAASETPWQSANIGIFNRNIPKSNIKTSHSIYILYICQDTLPLVVFGLSNLSTIFVVVCCRVLNITGNFIFWGHCSRKNTRHTHTRSHTHTHTHTLTHTHTHCLNELKHNRVLILP